VQYLDARRLRGTAIEADVAIVGAGAAGIALAMEFASGPARVALIEAGDLEHRHATQFLYLGENVGRRNYSTVFSRFRRFGGSTTRWGGQCRPFDPIDFEVRDGFDSTGWPFSFTHLEPYYRRAQQVCMLGRFDYDPAGWLDRFGGALRVSGELLQTRIYQFSHPTDFGLAYRERLRAAGNVDVYLNANLVEVLTDPDASRVTGLSLATLNRGRVTVRARHYVLACGGIENARLLLVSRGARPQGLGNDHDLVGRYFMDHPYFFPGYFEPAHKELDRSLYVIEGYEQVGSTQKVHAAISLSDRVLRQERLNGASLYLLRRPRYKAVAPYVSKGGHAFNHLLEALQHRDHPDGRLGQDLRDLATDVAGAGRTAWDRLGGILRRDPVLALRVVIETTPCRESRVTLGERRDRLGMPRVRVDWRVNEHDKRGYEHLMAVLRSELPRLGLGRLVEHGLYGDDGWPRSMLGGKHHIGTTRMHKDPALGVVDADCKVHGLDNLYVAGSSVFPTSGYANPTLTIVALAVRLADLLKERLNRPVA
jgi:choline dehydrogenase-like flavoprotein